MKLVSFVTVLVIVTVETADFNKLRMTPQYVQYVDWNEYMGKWYVYANIHPCSWKGAVKFSDWTHTYMMDTSRKGFTIKNQWRKSGSCSSTKEKCTPTSPGNYIVEDNLGDLWSGNVVIVDMDKHFQHYVLRWGCVRYLGDVCVDFWASVKTRTPNPSQKLLDKINRKLGELWDTSLGEMDIVYHTEPCDVAAQPLNRARKPVWTTY